MSFKVIDNCSLSNLHEHRQNLEYFLTVFWNLIMRDVNSSFFSDYSSDIEELSVILSGISPLIVKKICFANT